MRSPYAKRRRSNLWLPLFIVVFAVAVCLLVHCSQEWARHRVTDLEEAECAYQWTKDGRFVEPCESD